MARQEKSHEQSQHKGPAKNFGGPLRVVGTLLLAFLASQLIAALLVEIFLSIIHDDTNLSSLLNESVGAQFFYVLLAEGLAVGAVYLFLRRRKLAFSDIGLSRRPKWGDLKSGALGFGAFYVLLIIITIIVTWLIPSFDIDQTQNIGFESLNSRTDRLIAFTALVFLPAIGEEILMRGYLYTGLRTRLSFARALIVTSLIFGLAHLEFDNGGPLVWVAALNTFVLSAVLVWVREKTGALYSSVLIHMLNNGVAFTIHFL